MKVFGMGWLELVLILVVVLIIFGPKNLPKLGRALGNGIKSLRKGVQSGKDKIDEKFDAVEDEKAAQAAAGDTVEEVTEVTVEEEPEASGSTAPAEEDGVAPKKTVKVKRVVKSAGEKPGEEE